jgi:hypothetical protein
MVKFVGYSAEVYSLARPRQRTDGAVSFDETLAARLDFITNHTVIVRNGWVAVSERPDLTTFLKILPNLALRLTAGETYLHPQGRIYIEPGVNVCDFIQQIRSLHSEVADPLAQSEKYLETRRRLYHEDWDGSWNESERTTELFRVEIHGVAFCNDGKLEFVPVSRQFR